MKLDLAGPLAHKRTELRQRASVVIFNKLGYHRCRVWLDRLETPIYTRVRGQLIMRYL
jgi:hypothetical protein